MTTLSAAAIVPRYNTDRDASDAAVENFARRGRFLAAAGVIRLRIGTNNRDLRRVTWLAFLEALTTDIPLAAELLPRVAADSGAFIDAAIWRAVDLIAEGQLVHAGHLLAASSSCSPRSWKSELALGFFLAPTAPHAAREHFLLACRIAPQQLAAYRHLLTTRAPYEHFGVEDLRTVIQQ